MSGNAAPDHDRPVGVIGLGLMGSAMVARLDEAGRAVLGHDVDQAKREALEALAPGAAVPIAELARHCRTVVIAVYDAAQVGAVLGELAEHAADDSPLVICCTTCTPGEITDIASLAGRLRIALVEAPISGTSSELRAGTATALVGGAPEAIAAGGDVLNLLCPEHVQAGRAGNAARMKLAINLILQSNRAALAEGMVFAERLGLDTEIFLDAARRSAAGSKVMDSKGEKMRLREFTAQSHISQTLKDAELILHEAKMRHLPLPMTSAQVSLLRVAIVKQGADADSSAVIAAFDPLPARGERPR
jgi:3-hydroxyisobutyrate dehydrogenase